jgi:hypothetical protein
VARLEGCAYRRGVQKQRLIRQDQTRLAEEQVRNYFACRDLRSSCFSLQSIVVVDFDQAPKGSASE